MNPRLGETVNPPTATKTTAVTTAAQVTSDATISKVLPFPPFVTLIVLLALAALLSALFQWIWNLPHVMANSAVIDRLGGPDAAQHKVLRSLAFLSVAAGLLFGQFGSAVLVACGLMAVAYLRERRL